MNKNKVSKNLGGGVTGFFGGGVSPKNGPAGHPAPSVISVPYSPVQPSP